jgi:phosphate transport system substrate-binding protein
MKTLASLVGILVLASGCGHIQENGNQFDIIIDGSSTVYPIAELSVESYQKNETDVDISLSYSGTSSGLRKLCSGEIDLANASGK